MDIHADTFIAGASMFVALCALVATIWQSSVIRKHNRLSVKPALNITHKDYPALNITQNDYNDKNQTTVEYHLSNLGVGPAIIKDFILTYNGEEISRNNHTNYAAFMNKHGSKFINKHGNKSMNPSWYWLAPNATLAANQEITLLKFTYDNETGGDAKELVENLAFLVRYCSIYEDKIFELDSRDARQFH